MSDSPFHTAPGRSRPASGPFTNTSHAPVAPSTTTGDWCGSNITNQSPALTTVAISVYQLSDDREARVGGDGCAETNSCLAVDRRCEPRYNHPFFLGQIEAYRLLIAPDNDAVVEGDDARVEGDQTRLRFRQRNPVVAASVVAADLNPGGLRIVERAEGVQRLVADGRQRQVVIAPGRKVKSLTGVGVEPHEGSLGHDVEVLAVEDCRKSGVAPARHW